MNTPLSVYSLWHFHLCMNFKVSIQEWIIELLHKSQCPSFQCYLPLCQTLSARQECAFSPPMPCLFCGFACLCITQTTFKLLELNQFPWGGCLSSFLLLLQLWLLGDKVQRRISRKLWTSHGLIMVTIRSVRYHLFDQAKNMVNMEVRSSELKQCRETKRTK